MILVHSIYIYNAAQKTIGSRYKYTGTGTGILAVMPQRSMRNFIMSTLRSSSWTDAMRRHMLGLGSLSRLFCWQISIKFVVDYSRPQRRVDDDYDYDYIILYIGRNRLFIDNYLYTKRVLVIMFFNWYFPHRRFRLDFTFFFPTHRYTRAIDLNRLEMSIESSLEVDIGQLFVNSTQQFWTWNFCTSLIKIHITYFLVVLINKHRRTIYGRSFRCTVYPGGPN